MDSNNTRYIYIHQGDDSDWNGDQFLTVNVSSASTGVDLSTMSAVFTLGSFSQTYPLENGSFVVNLAAAVTGQYLYGPICGSIKILDSQNRIRTVANKIPFYVTDDVITLQNQDLVIDVPGVTIDVTVGGTVNYNNLSNKPSINGKIIEGQKDALYYNLTLKTDFDAHIEDTNNPHQVTKEQVGLGNVDNTADLDKPVSIATQAALDRKQDNLTQTQLAAVNSGADREKIANIAQNAQAIGVINSKIPAQASANNQLADKGFVNSTVQTSTAHFRGNWPTWAAVPTNASLYPADEFGTHEPGPNDYMVVQADETQDGGTWRYKYTGSWAINGKNGWEVEYEVNETPLTAAQLAALNSRITVDKVTEYDSHIVNNSNPHNVTKTQVGLGNVDNTSDANKPISTAVQVALDAKQDKLNSAQLAAVNSGVTMSTVSQVSFNSSRLTAFAPYIQSAAVRDMNEQETVNAADLLAATGDLHALNLDLSQNTVLKKLTAAGTSGSLANLSGVLVSPFAPLDGATSPQIDLSYSALNKTALVNLFHSMPYNVGYNVIGNPTIVDGIVTDFTRTSYLRTNLQFDFSQTDYEFVIRATPHAVSTRNAAIVGTQTSGLRIYFQQNSIQCYPGNNTVFSVNGTFDVSSFYYVRLIRKGNVYTLDYSSDGINYTGTVSVTNQQHLSRNLFLQFGYYANDGWDPLNGSIDIAHSYIKGNGAIWFRGTATMSKTCDVRGCSGTADLTAEDKAIVTDKGWSLTVA